MVPDMWLVAGLLTENKLSLWSYLQKFGKITKEMTPSLIPSSVTQPGSGQALEIQLCRQNVLKEETEAKEELMVLLGSIPDGSTIAVRLSRNVKRK